MKPKSKPPRRENALNKAKFHRKQRSNKKQTSVDPISEAISHPEEQRNIALTVGIITAPTHQSQAKRAPARARASPT